MTDAEIVSAIAWLTGGIIVVVAVTGLSRKVGWSAPLVLVAVGVAAAFVPAVPQVELQPDLILVGVLPALLFASAIRTSLLEVRARSDSILTLSVALVIFSTFAVGLVAWWIVPGVGFAAAIAFGAIIAPTDAVSVTSLAGGSLPRRVFTLLEGESLLNDATALVALSTALLAITQTVGAGDVAIKFAVAVVGGIASGALVAWIMSEIRRRLKAPVLDTSLSLITPYAAFLPAFLVGGSGVLAVVTTGLWLGYRSPVVQSAEARIAERLNWRTIEFLLENAVFLLIGLQLPRIVKTVSKGDIPFLPAVGICIAIYLTMVAARFAWVMLATAIYRYGPEALRERRWTWSSGVVISFAGMRGVVTLAAVFLLPTTIPNVGFLRLLAFVIVVASLLQGLGIVPLARALKLPLPSRDQDTMQIRSLIAEAQTAALDRLDKEAGENDPAELVSSLRASAQYRIAVGTTDEDNMSTQPDSYARLRLLMLQSERKAVLDARREGRYEETAVNAVLGDFDTIEAAMKRSYRRDLTPPATPSRFTLSRLLRLATRSAPDGDAANDPVTEADPDPAPDPAQR
jgi:monovalent cation/hydrogen antiporter